MPRQLGLRTAHSAAAAIALRAAQIAATFQSTSLIRTPAVLQNTPHSASRTSARRWSLDIVTDDMLPGPWNARGGSRVQRQIKDPHEVCQLRGSGGGARRLQGEQVAARAGQRAGGGG